MLSDPRAPRDLRPLRPRGPSPRRLPADRFRPRQPLRSLLGVLWGRLFGGAGRAGGRARRRRRGDLSRSPRRRFSRRHGGGPVAGRGRAAIAAEGVAPSRARRRVTCPTCGGAGRVQQVSQSVFGQFVRASTCPRCDGAGRSSSTPASGATGRDACSSTASLEVEIPAGIHDGQRIRLAWRGARRSARRAAGRRLVLVRVARLRASRATATT